MNNYSYIGLSGQLAMERRLETIAHNVANASTAGFRAEQIRFDSVLSQSGADPVAYARLGGTYLSRASGGIKQTGNPLDVAVEGDGWLAISTKSGTAYTRDGRMRITQAGELQSITGAPYLDAGGAPIIIDPAAGPIGISRDGRVMQNNRQVGALGLFTIPEGAHLARSENSSVVPDTNAEPVVDFSKTGLAQGYLENSNVDPVKEISHMILVQRQFDAITATLNTADAAVDAGVRDLGNSK